MKGVNYGARVTGAGGRQGFTLIELSIVLVVIGLVVGGVLVGQDLTRSAGERAQIAQIESYSRAANTFRAKYGELPGDLDAVTASSLGFAARGSFRGQGDGNGKIEGINCNTADYCANRGSAGSGEAAMFWVDLSKASLIEGSFSTATPSAVIASFISPTTTPGVGAYFPAAKIGQGNYIYVWSGGMGPCCGGYPGSNPKGDGFNYFGIGAILDIWSGFFNGEISENPGLSSRQAYEIDKKMDDGLPQSGAVTAMFLWQGVTWVGDGGPVPGNYPFNGAYPGAAATASSTTCYDNGGDASGTVAMTYSLSYNGGAGVNCALSFRFQ